LNERNLSSLGFRAYVEPLDARMFEAVWHVIEDCIVHALHHACTVSRPDLYVDRTHHEAPAWQVGGDVEPEVAVSSAAKTGWLLVLESDVNRGEERESRLTAHHPENAKRCP
jgi:hypothetical protein